MLNSVRNAASDIHSFRHSTILYMDSTVCIHLNDVKRLLSRTVKFPSDICTGHKYFITNLVFIVYLETIFPGIVGLNDFCFLSLMASQSAMNFKFNSMSRLKINCASEACSVVWCVLWIAQATEADRKSTRLNSSHRT